MYLGKKEYNLLLILILVTLALGGCSYGDIDDKIEEYFRLEMEVGNLEIFASDQGVKETTAKIISLAAPYDQARDEDKAVLLYEDEVVVVESANDGARIEVTEHDEAYERHSHIITNHWGSKIRNGNIGSPPSRSGGFGFGK